MPKPRIYVESTIPSAYHTGRTDPAMVERHLATRRWWDVAVNSCDLVTSVTVKYELARGKSPYVPLRLALLDGLHVLDVDPTALETAAVYIRHKLMPADPLGDALHLAMASHHKCDVLLTWNYRHLANRTKLERIHA
jgi:predicted nucleic acid-binding protein